MCLLLVSLLHLQLLCMCLATPRHVNGFFYDDNGTGNGKQESMY